MSGVRVIFDSVGAARAETARQSTKMSWSCSIMFARGLARALGTATPAQPRVGEWFGCEWLGFNVGVLGLQQRVVRLTVPRTVLVRYRPLDVALLAAVQEQITPNAGHSMQYTARSRSALSAQGGKDRRRARRATCSRKAVSYTHLTLPTKA